MYELKIYRGAMCDDNEEWCKIWRGIDELPQFDEFCPSTRMSQISQIFISTLMGSIWPKYIMF